MKKKVLINSLDAHCHNFFLQYPFFKKIIYQLYKIARLSGFRYCDKAQYMKDFHCGGKPILAAAMVFQALTSILSLLLLCGYAQGIFSIKNSLRIFFWIFWKFFVFGSWFCVVGNNYFISGLIRLCYYDNTAQFRPTLGRFFPEDIDSSYCSHIVYSKAFLNEGVLVPSQFNDEDM